MTDKQRLQANNEALQEIKERILQLTVSTESGGTKQIEIELPSVFAGVSDIYYMQTTKNTVLCSASTVALWLYKIKEKEWKQVSTTKFLTGFYQISNTKFLLTAGQSGINPVLYDTETETTSGVNYRFFGGLNIFAVTDSKLIFSCSTSYLLNEGLFEIDVETGAVTRVYDTVADWKPSAKEPDCWIMYSNKSGSGILTYNPITSEVNKIYSDGINWTNAFKVNDTKYILYSSDSNAKGLLRYRIHDTEAHQIYPDGYNWRYFYKANENTILVGGSGSSSPGVLLYKIDTDNVKKVVETGSSWQYFQTIKDRCLVASTNSSYRDVYAIDLIAETSEIAYSNSSLSVNTFILVAENKCLFSGNYSGIYLYNYDTKEVTNPYTQQNNWRFSYQVNAVEWLLSSGSSSAGLVLYNSTDDSFNKVVSNSYHWNIFERVGDVVLISSTSRSNNFLSYNVTDKNAKTLVSNCGYMDTFEHLENGDVRVSSTTSSNKRILQYYVETDKASLIGFKMEVQL